MSAHPAGLRQEQYLKYEPHRQYLVRPLPFAEMRESAKNYYDNGVLQADAKIAELLQALGAKGYLENTLVVLTADHGEALGENGVFAHGNGVSEEELRIPLFMIAYGYTPARLAHNPAVSQVDIAPTVLAELGIAPPSIWDGTPLQSRIRRRYSFFQERYTAGFIDHQDERTVWKYWTDVRTGEEFAVDLNRDPTGRDNKVRSVDAKLRREWREAFLEIRPAVRGASSRPHP
jgi:arylsulfatase A-like enzyme